MQRGCRVRRGSYNRHYFKSPLWRCSISTEQDGLTAVRLVRKFSNRFCFETYNFTRHKEQRYVKKKLRYFDHLFLLYRPMWLLGSTSQVMMMMDERLSPSARSVQNQGDNPSTVHSIEAILGFKEDTIFHKSACYSMTENVLVKDAERNVIMTPLKKSHSSESFDSTCSPHFSINSI